jgi:cation:H+ antiporter
MPIWLAVLQLFGGIVYLLLGADLLVRGAIALSRRLGIPAMVVGLTVVAFGTSMPELVVSLRAALAGLPDLAIANVVGSNIANVLLVAALPAMVYPMACDQPGARRDALFVVFTSAIFIALCWKGPLGRVDGFILLGGLAAFLAYVSRASGLGQIWRAESAETTWVLGLPSRRYMIAIFIAFGALALPLGAELLVDGAVGVADVLEVPQAIVGLTIVAVGTSLPELATTLVAALKREADVAIGNILGSNVLNLFAIMGASALASPEPMPVPDRMLEIDLPVMFGAAVAMALLIFRGRPVGRAAGALLLAGYLSYVGFLYGVFG